MVFLPWELPVEIWNRLEFGWDDATHEPHAIASPQLHPLGTIREPDITKTILQSIHPQELKALEAQIILGNTYHLWVRPGTEIIGGAGGLHDFMQWDGPILTDSGGFQVLSLADLRSIDDEAVVFRSHLDGQELRLTPERVLDIQACLGTDIAMVLDDCPPPGVDKDGARVALERSLLWAERSIRHRADSPVGEAPMAVFGILQA